MYFPKNYENSRLVALRSLTIGTLGLCLSFSILLGISWLLGGNHVAARLFVSITAFVYLLGVLYAVRIGKSYVGAAMLVSFYAIVASVSLWQWGINIAFAVLLLGITITLAGILISARYALVAGISATLIILTLQTITSLKLYNPDVSWQTGAQSLYGEALGYCLLFITVSLVSWHFGRQTEASLAQAKSATKALEEQKKILAHKLKQQSKKLKALQLKEMQQLYKFAELGQLSTALMHDLANHVSVLALDLEDLSLPSTKHRIDSARTSISYIEKIVDEMRQQLREDEALHPFELDHRILQVIEAIENRAKGSTTKITFVKSAKKPVMLFGDPLRFDQVLSVLLLNAVDAVKSVSSVDDLITVRVLISGHEANVSVADHGPGIPHKERFRVFKPFFGTKDKGMGIGLFVAREITRTHFHGKLYLARRSNPTTFCMSVPIYKPRKSTNSLG